MGMQEWNVCENEIVYIIIINKFLQLLITRMETNEETGYITAFPTYRMNLDSQTA